jgi:hypothetical protein
VVNRCSRQYSLSRTFGRAQDRINSSGADSADYFTVAIIDQNRLGKGIVGFFRPRCRFQIAR